MKGVAVVLLTVLAVAYLVGPSEAVTCSQVNGALASCVTFLTGGGAPSSQCCGGVRNLNAITSTKADRQAACTCLKEISARYKNIKDDAAASLPQKCNVQVSVPISRSTDCSSIS